MLETRVGVEKTGCVAWSVAHSVFGCNGNEKRECETAVRSDTILHDAV